MIFLKAEISIKPGNLNDMLALLQFCIFPILEGKGGWRMCGCFVQRTGQLNTIVDIWELEDYGHFERAYAVFREDPNYAAIRVELDRYVEMENIVFMEHQFGSISGSR